MSSWFFLPTSVFLFLPQSISRRCRKFVISIAHGVHVHIRAYSPTCRDTWTGREPEIQRTLTHTENLWASEMCLKELFNHKQHFYAKLFASNESNFAPIFYYCVYYVDSGNAQTVSLFLRVKNKNGNKSMKNSTRPGA